MTDVDRPSERPFPVDILVERRAGELRIEWSDGHVSVYRFDYLLEHFPEEQPSLSGNGQRSEKVEVSSLRVLEGGSIEIEYEGRGGGGVYSAEHLRRICPCEEHEGSVEDPS